MNDKTPAERLREMIEGAELTQEQVAEMMTRRSGRPVSKRAVQAWLADPNRPSARPCPDWAPDLLASALGKKGRR